MPQDLDKTDLRVVSIQVGGIAPLGTGPRGSVPSGFVKLPVAGPVHTKPVGLFGDQQADLTVHGGPDKAVYWYPSEHYPAWVRDVPRHERMLVPGAFGENITARGLNEDSVSVGQVFRVGTSEFQVTQPRQPCFKLALRFDDPSLGRIMMQTGRTGWYTRILKAGTLQAGDQAHILHRPDPSWTIARLNALLLNPRRPRGEYVELASLEGLADGWKRDARDAAVDATER